MNKRLIKKRTRQLTRYRKIQLIGPLNRQLKCLEK